MQKNHKNVITWNSRVERKRKRLRERERKQKTNRERQRRERRERGKVRNKKKRLREMRKRKTQKQKNQSRKGKEKEPTIGIWSMERSSSMGCLSQRREQVWGSSKESSLAREYWNHHYRNDHRQFQIFLNLKI